MEKPLTDEEIWGVPAEDVPDAEDKDFPVCPTAGTYCSYYVDGSCRSRLCVLDLDNGI